MKMISDCAIITFVKSEGASIFEIEAPFLFSKTGNKQQKFILEGIRLKRNAQSYRNYRNRRMVMDRKVVRIC